MLRGVLGRQCERGKGGGRKKPDAQPAPAVLFPRVGCKRWACKLLARRHG